MSQKVLPKFIFISGLPRSGEVALLRSFDYHPEVLAWPVEFFYFEFFEKIKASTDKITVRKLNTALESIFTRQLISEIKRESAELEGYFQNTEFPKNKNINIGGFDFQLFFEKLRLREFEEINAVEYLKYIFDCMKQANSYYEEKSIKYYLLCTTARGLNWNDKKLIRSSSILFSCREMESSYNSLREKIFFKNGYDLKTAFSIKTKKSFLYWLESYRRISKQVEPYIKQKNIFVVPLKKLQRNPEEVLNKICKFLNIAPHSNLYNLTTFGFICSGNANQSSLNIGKIATTSSKISIPLSSFERRMFNSISLYDFTELKKRSFIPLRLFEMLKLAYTNAFFELPTDKIWIREKNSPIHNIYGRICIFFNICAVFFIMKNKRLALAVIRKRNKHIENMPIWNESV